MKKYYLNIEGFINPKWFRDNVNKEYLIYINNECKINIDGVTLYFQDRNEALPAGTKMIVFINSYGSYCCDAEEYNNHLLEKMKKFEKEKEDYRLKSIAKMEESIAFNSQIKLPVKWDVGIKSVLSGLSINSWGDGRKKNTVNILYYLKI